MYNRLDNLNHGPFERRVLIGQNASPRTARLHRPMHPDPTATEEAFPMESTCCSNAYIDLSGQVCKAHGRKENCVDNLKHGPFDHAF